MTREGVIYDFGMNNGDSTAYYLTKGVPVVGVDANQKLCDFVGKRFEREVQSGQLTIVPVALSEQETDELLTFYIHKTNHGLSTLLKPADPSQFDVVQVPCRTPSSIIKEHGDPLYVKIDIEHYDQHVLREIFSAGIFPPEISAESLSVEVFALLVAYQYKSFNIVDGGFVAGPFGEDIKTPWEDAETLFYRLAAEGLGWKDIHASMIYPPNPTITDAEVIRQQGYWSAKKMYRRVRDGLRSRIFKSGEVEHTHHPV
jgi:FkbM family methyltransferase